MCADNPREMKPCTGAPVCSRRHTCEAFWGVILLVFRQPGIPQLHHICSVGFTIDHVPKNVQGFVKGVNQATVGTVHHLGG